VNSNGYKKSQSKYSSTSFLSAIKASQSLQTLQQSALSKYDQSS